MNYWILTVGSSDVYLTVEGSQNWENRLSCDRNLRQNYPDVQAVFDTNKILQLSETYSEEYKSAKTRLLGYLYHHVASELYEKYLYFPLLEQCCKLILENETANINSVIVLLTDQSKLFPDNSEDRSNGDSPYWQDTCELEEILDWYIQQKLKVKPEFVTIEPHENQGVDNWNAMLSEVKTKLVGKLSEIKANLQEGDRVYVSHQAGTPAISSAVQFVTIGQLGNYVKFLVVNRSFQDDFIIETANVLESSNYWRDLQIEKAKQLIQKGEPGSALEILRLFLDEDEKNMKELRDIEARFNLRATDTDIAQEFEPQQAATRIQDALELSEILLGNGKYALALVLIAATHETFLKAGIKHLLEGIHCDIRLKSESDVMQLIDLIAWNNQGLRLESRRNIEESLSRNLQEDFRRVIDSELDLSRILHFPEPEKNLDYYNSQDLETCGDWSNWKNYLSRENNAFSLGNIHKYKPFNINNSRAWKWFKKLLENHTNTSIDEWPLMEWIGKFKREYELDRRNQTVHNLRGLTAKDAIGYLLGNPTEQTPKYQEYSRFLDENANPSADDVVGVYKKEILEIFEKTLKDIGLDDNGERQTLQQRLDTLANHLGRISQF